MLVSMIFAIRQLLVELVGVYETPVLFIAVLLFMLAVVCGAV